MKQLSLKTPAYRYVEKSFKEWLDALGYAESTTYNLPHHVREFLHWLEQQGCDQLGTLDVPLFQKYYDQLKERANRRRGGALSNAYLNKHLQALYRFAEYLRRSGRLILPALDLGWEESNTEQIEVLSTEEVKDLFRVTEGYHEDTKLEPLNARDRAILCVFYSCGLRRSEGYYLDVSDINLDRQLVHVRRGKGYKERLVPFNKRTAKYLEDYLYESRPLLLEDKREPAFFISQRGKRMQSQSMARRLKLLQERTNNAALQEKNIHLHILRHSIATHLLQNGMSLEKIARFLGHTSLESTQIYTHRTMSGDN